MKSKLIYDENGEVVSHRIWFKSLLNPILRPFGRVIVTELNHNNEVVRYHFGHFKKGKISI